VIACVNPLIVINKPQKENQGIVLDLKRIIIVDYYSKVIVFKEKYYPAPSPQKKCEPKT
jgi:hypothetical protein